MIVNININEIKLNCLQIRIAMFKGIEVKKLRTLG